MVANIMNNTKFLLLSTVVEDIRSKCDNLCLSSLLLFSHCLFLKTTFTDFHIMSLNNAVKVVSTGLFCPIFPLKMQKLRKVDLCKLKQPISGKNIC